MGCQARAWRSELRLSVRVAGSADGIALGCLGYAMSPSWPTVRVSTQGCGGALRELGLSSLEDGNRLLHRVGMQCQTVLGLGLVSCAELA